MVAEGGTAYTVDDELVAPNLDEEERAQPQRNDANHEEQNEGVDDARPANEDDDEDDFDWTANQPAEPLKIAPAPRQPSAAEVEQHRITHVPFQPWCLECLKGKATGQKRNHQSRDHEIARVGVDYFFLTGLECNMLRRRDMAEQDYPENAEGEEKLVEARRTGVVVKCLLIRCHKTRAIFAHAVPSKA